LCAPCWAVVSVVLGPDWVLFYNKCGTINHHVHNIQGRGCVITWRLERGKLKVRQELVVIVYKGKVTIIEEFHKILEEANVGDQMVLLVRGLKQTDVRKEYVHDQV